MNCQYLVTGVVKSKGEGKMILLVDMYVLALLLLGCVCPMATKESSDKAACPTIVSRADWRAKPPKDRTDLKTPVPFFILHHTLMDECFDYETCGAEMRKIQNFHQIQRNWSDIGYNYCVGEDGRVYEGRGWDTVGAHAPWYNFHSIGICIMGNFTSKLPNQASIDAVFWLINCALENNKLEESYILYGHRQVRHTECPGDALFEEIQSWPHWKPGKHYPPEPPDQDKPSILKEQHQKR